MASTGLPGITIHGKSIRVDFMHQGMRYRHTLGLEPTKANLKHAAQLRAAALHGLKTGTYNEAALFPNSRSTESTHKAASRLDDLLRIYLPLKAVDITPETQIRYEIALNTCLQTLGKDRQISALQPIDIQQLRVDLIATRAVSTVNHYLATLIGFLNWCEDNNYCQGLAKHCTRFAKSDKDPDPFSHEEFNQIVALGCMHPIDKAAVTLAFYTGLRPGELCALAVEDIAADFSRITVRRSVTQSLTFKVPKTGKERMVLLYPPAQDGLRLLVAEAKERMPISVQVWLNRHEFRTDTVRILLSPKTQARKVETNDWFVPTAWNTKWGTLLRRAGVRHRPPYQTRHTYACWNLTAQGNLAFIANQMGHNDYSMLVKVYGRWIDSESPRELERIWEGMRKLAESVPKLSQSASL